KMHDLNRALSNRAASLAALRGLTLQKLLLMKGAGFSPHMTALRLAGALAPRICLPKPVCTTVSCRRFGVVTLIRARPAAPPQRQVPYYLAGRRNSKRRFRRNSPLP